jgi:hypothetical protein
MPRPSAHIHEVICAGVAPKACAAWNTSATELVKPTSTATKPAVKADKLRSLKKRMAADSGTRRDARLTPVAGDHRFIKIHSCSCACRLHGQRTDL